MEAKETGNAVTSIFGQDDTYTSARGDRSISPKITLITQTWYFYIWVSGT